MSIIIVSCYASKILSNDRRATLSQVSPEFNFEVSTSINVRTVLCSMQDMGFDGQTRVPLMTVRHRATDMATTTLYISCLETRRAVWWVAFPNELLTAGEGAMVCYVLFWILRGCLAYLQASVTGQYHVCIFSDEIHSFMFFIHADELSLLKQDYIPPRK